MNRYITKMKFVVKTKAINNPIKEIIHISILCKFIFSCFVGWTCRTTIDDTYLFNFICNFFFILWLKNQLVCKYYMQVVPFFDFLKLTISEQVILEYMYIFLSKCIQYCISIKCECLVLDTRLEKEILAVCSLSVKKEIKRSHFLLIVLLYGQQPNNHKLVSFYSRFYYLHIVI